MPKNYDEYTKEELIDQLKKLESRKKYGLVWEDKPEDVVEQCKKELPVLKEVSSRKIEKDPGGPVNLLIEGDNYHALSVLNYTHAGKIDVIYTDPPYNTGNKDFIYNDRYVDKEDGFKHSKWLSFMAKRLKIAKSLLSEKGIIFISIDDNEQAHLKLLCDEIFTKNNFVAPIIVNSNSSKNNSRYIGVSHEYVLVYAKNISLLEGGWSVKKNNVDEFSKRANQLVARGLSSDEIHKELLELVKYPRFYDLDHFTFADKKGVYQTDNPGGVKNGNKKSVVIHPVTNKPCTIPDGGWRYKDEEIQRLIKEDLFEFGKDETIVPRPKRYLKDYIEQTPKSSIFFDSQSSTKTLKKMKIAFDFPKATELIEYLISMYPTNKTAVILDFFAGSGTTGHAVINLNKRDSGQRKFILCTDNERKIAEEITYPRIKKVIEGYSDTKGIPANLRYFRTDFVSKSKATDDTRRKLMDRSTEMICVKEGTYEKLYDNKDFKIYKGSRYIAGILFNLDKIAVFKKQIEKLKMPASIYVFSLTADSFKEDFADLSVKHEMVPVPESILEVYRKVFK